MEKKTWNLLYDWGIHLGTTIGMHSFIPCQILKPKKNWCHNQADAIPPELFEDLGLLGWAFGPHKI